MVITRSQSDLEDARERGFERETEERRMLGPPASPSTQREAALIDIQTTTPGPSSTRQPTRTRSPGRSVRSTSSAVARRRMAEMEAAEKLLALKRRELELEADFIQKKLAADLAAINEDEEGSLRGEAATEDHHQKVDTWLRTNPLSKDASAQKTQERQLRFERRGRSPTPTRTKNSIDQLASTLEKMIRPTVRCADLPNFDGTPSEWLTFKASFRDSTRLYNISAVENIQRLRSRLQGTARNTVAALLYTATDPEVIMKTLEQTFGKPELIIDRAFDDLRRLPKLGPTAVELNNFAVRLQNVVYVLKNIDRHGYLYNPMLAREALEKLSPHVRSRWCDYAMEHSGTTEPEIMQLSRFLMREADKEMRFLFAPSTSATTRSEVRPTAVAVVKRKPTSVFNVTESQEEIRKRCPSCGQEHELYECQDYKSLTINERWRFVKEKGLCFKCVSKKHQRAQCKEKSCGVNQCHRPHHRTLHQEEGQREQSSAAPSATDEAVLSVATKRTTDSGAVLLKVCPVTVVGPRGEMKTYALLDEGATISLMDQELARKIGAKGPKRHLHMHGVNMSQTEEDSQLVTVQLKDREGVLHKLRARTVVNLKLRQQSVPSTLLNQEHLRDLPSDQVCYDLARPGILVGTDHWEFIVSRELRVGKRNQPAASRTQLGWVIHGTAPRQTILKDEDSTLHVYNTERGVTAYEQEDRRLHDLVDKHFKIDALGVAHKPRVSDTDARAQNVVEQTLRKTNRGYEVGLPWRNDEVQLPPSYDAAFRRLRKIEQKMDAHPEFAKEYTKQIENLLQKDYAVPCDGTEHASPTSWYLPHFAVENPNKPGKLRLVFDAAAKSRGVCLNDYLLEGPDLLTSLQGIMFRFREKPIAITADIQEMFLQIKIRAEDQPAQQFLWRGADRTAPPKRFKMTSMIFGAASSPFMAHFVRNYNAT